jgi:hypothetical protein
MVLMSFVNSPIVPILSGFGEHGGVGLHEKPHIPPCSIADGAQRARGIDVPKIVSDHLRWNKAERARI